MEKQTQKQKQSHDRNNDGPPELHPQAEQQQKQEENKEDDNNNGQQQQQSVKEQQQQKEVDESSRQQQPKPQEPVAVLFNGKLRIYDAINLPMFGADVLVNFCVSDILSGDECFLNVHELAGDELKAFSAQYQGIGIGSCRFSNSFGLTNFKKIAHCILPRPVQGADDFTDLDELVEFDLALCYRNAMDLAMEAGSRSILFTHPLLYADRYGVAKVAVAVLSHWMDMSPYAENLQQISIACPDQEIAQCYVEIVRDLTNRGWEEFVLSHSSTLYATLLDSYDLETEERLRNEQDVPCTSASAIGQKPLELKICQLQEYDDALADVHMLDAIFDREFPALELMAEEQEQEDIEIVPNLQQQQQMQRRKFNQSQKTIQFDENEEQSNMMSMPPYENPNLNQFCIDQYGFDEMYIREHPDEVYDMLFRSPDGLQLQLSRNLSATILTIEEEQGGMLRQYRITTQNREGETLYFRCSRCESLMRYTMEEYRPKLTVRDGFIHGDCFPLHHPQCYPVTKEWVILQQLDRQARLWLLQQHPQAAGSYGEGPQQQKMAAAQTGEDGEILLVDDAGTGRTETGTSGSGIEGTTVKQYLTGQMSKYQRVFRQSNQPQQANDATGGVVLEDQTSSSARTRLRPRPSGSSSGSKHNGQTASSSARRMPISVATPRYNLVQRNPSEMPIVYRRNERPENATLRAIRKCENELEGRVNDELERALAAQENMEFWKNPLARLGASLGSYIPHYMAPPGRRRQMDQFMELGHEEEVVAADPMMEEDIEQTQEQQQQEQNIMTISKQIDQQQQQNQAINGHHRRHDQMAIDQMPSTSQQQEQSKQNGEEHPVLAAEVPMVGSGWKEQLSKGTDEAGGKQQRKSRMIRKRGGETNLAFDWREADLDGMKMNMAKRTQ